MYEWYGTLNNKSSGSEIFNLHLEDDYISLEIGTQYIPCKFSSKDSSILYDDVHNSILIASVYENNDGAFIGGTAFQNIREYKETK